jgi:hypothetical protein
MHISAVHSEQRTPLAAELSVREGRDRYLSENGFTVAAYDDPRTQASFFGVDFSVPNTPKHRWAIMLHDLHHVATGFGTDPIGEGEVSAWELRSSKLSSLGLYVGSIVAGGTLLGFLLAPRRALSAFRQGGVKPSLLDRADLSYEEILQLSIGELRALLAIPQGGLAEHPRQLHRHAPPLAAAASVAA